MSGAIIHQHPCAASHNLKSCWMASGLLHLVFCTSLHVKIYVARCWIESDDEWQAIMSTNINSWIVSDEWCYHLPAVELWSCPHLHQQASPSVTITLVQTFSLVLYILGLPSNRADTDTIKSIRNPEGNRTRLFFWREEKWRCRTRKIWILRNEGIDRTHRRIEKSNM